LPGAKVDIADNAVALVQYSQDRDPLSHRSDAGVVGARRAGLRPRPVGGSVVFAAAPTGPKRQREPEREREAEDRTR